MDEDNIDNDQDQQNPEGASAEQPQQPKPVEIPAIFKLAREKKVGKIFRMLDASSKQNKGAEEGNEEEKEQPADSGENPEQVLPLKDIVGVKDPETHHYLVHWATIEGHFQLVEAIVKEGRIAYGIADEKNLQIFDEWKAERPKIAEREEERRKLQEQGEQPEEEEEKPFEERLAEELQVSKYKVAEIGSIGLYEGQLSQETAKRDGVGSALFPNDDAYMGQYKDNMRHGNGVYVYAAGGFYCGQWSDNKKSGLGRMVYPDKSRYFGHWENNLRNGEGVQRYPNGDEYVGAWKDDVKHGKGLYSFKADKTIYDGVWESGVFVSGKWKFANNVIYDGAFVDGKPCGAGAFLFQRQGIQQHGHYLKGGQWYPTKTVDVEPKKLKEEPKFKPSIYLVLGPSGVGKDTLLNGARAKLTIHPRYIFMRRVITRPPGGDEDHEPTTAEEFATRKARGEFIMSWDAHGLSYGIKYSDLMDALKRGKSPIVNVSRTIIGEVQEKFGATYKVVVVEINADPEVIRQRLTSRGRESAQDIEERIQRSVEMSKFVKSQAKNLAQVLNNGTIEEGVQQLLNAFDYKGLI